MAALFGKASTNSILLAKLQTQSIVRNTQISRPMSTLRKLSLGKKIALGTCTLITVGGVGLGVALNQSVTAADMEMHPPSFPWSHSGVFQALDHKSVRRGYQVYKEVCAACHSMNSLCYRHLVGATHTEEEAKAEAAEVLVPDGPDDEGNMFERPGKLSDKFPNPYRNEEEARHANNGAFPPDMSYITSARHGGEDYVFSILTGYYDPPNGIQLADEQFYNVYFPGGAISMAPALYNEIIEYPDGTPANKSQLAKDVCTFLKWAAEPEHDTRMRYAIKVMFIFSMFIPLTYFYKRHKWSTLKSRKFSLIKRR